MRTQVGIVGGGPAGLLLSHLLHLEGIESIVLERRSREDLETTVRAGVLEHGTAELLKEVGVGERMQREGSVHHGIELRFGGRGHRIDFGDLTEGLSITIYGQQEVVKDLIRARLEADGKVLFEARAESVGDLDTDSPKIRFLQDGQQEEISCDYVAGCDGSLGVCRRTGIPENLRTQYTRTYPFGWFGILVHALTEFYGSGNKELLDAYSEICLRRVWRAQRFSWWMTSMLHRFDRSDPFQLKVQQAELDYVTTSRAAATTIAENYVGAALNTSHPL